TQTPSTASDLVPVYVPRHLLQKVYELLANDGSNGAPSSTRPTPPHKPQNGGSTSAHLETRRERQLRLYTPERLNDLWGRSSAPLRKVLAHCRAHPDTWVSAPDFVALLGEDWEEARLWGVLGWLGRHVKGLFPGETEAPWPLDYEERDDENWYLMPSAI